MSGSREKVVAAEGETIPEKAVEVKVLLEDKSVSEKDDFDYSIRCERAQVADHLEILARSFREGQVKLSTGDKSIALNPAPRVKLELKAETKPEKSKGELKIKISWKEKDIANPISINPTV